MHPASAETATKGVKELRGNSAGAIRSLTLTLTTVFPFSRKLRNRGNTFPLTGRKSLSSYDAPRKRVPVLSFTHTSHEDFCSSSVSTQVSLSPCCFRKCSFLTLSFGVRPS